MNAIGLWPAPVVPDRPGDDAAHRRPHSKPISPRFEIRRFFKVLKGALGLDPNGRQMNLADTAMMFADLSVEDAGMK